MIGKALGVCRGCGRVVGHHKEPDGRVSRRYAYRHLCPHWTWCLAGDRLTGRVHFNQPRCPKCVFEGHYLKGRTAPDGL